MTLDDWRLACSAWTHRGHTVFFRQGGADTESDTTLLLIHGFPTSSWDWKKVWEPLCADFTRVVAADMIGFGLSAKPRGYPYSISDQADLHEDLLAHLGVRRVHILAHDYGDTVAQELLARHTERQEGTREVRDDGGATIESCVFLNGGLFPETHRARLVQKLMLTPLGPLLGLLMNRRTFDRSFSAVFGASTRPSPNEIEDFWRLIRHERGNRILHRLLRYIPERRANRERWVGVLQKTHVRLRLIDGPADPVSGQHMVDRYRELIPNPDVVTLPGIGHYPQVEDPDGVLRAFGEFHSRK